MRFVVEDDYDSEFRYDREPVGVLQGLAPDRVFTLGTVSKSLAPAVRLGWVIAPPALAGAVAAEKLLSDRGTVRPGPAGAGRPAAVGALRPAPAADARDRTRGAARRSSRRWRRHAPAVRLTGLAAGFHAVAHLPASADERGGGGGRAAPVGRAVRDGPFRASRGAAPPQLVLGFGLVSERAIEAGIAAVADLLR